MNPSSFAVSIVLVTSLFLSATLNAQTCPQLIFVNSFEDGQRTITTVPVDGATDVELEDIISATFSDKVASYEM